MMMGSESVSGIGNINVRKSGLKVSKLPDLAYPSLFIVAECDICQSLKLNNVR
jgi:hypothetical protein